MTESAWCIAQSEEEVNAMRSALCALRYALNLPD
jgi:hypothetical protein